MMNIEYPLSNNSKIKVLDLSYSLIESEVVTRSRTKKETNAYQQQEESVDVTFHLKKPCGLCGDLTVIMLSHEELTIFESINSASMQELLTSDSEGLRSLGKLIEYYRKDISDEPPF